MGVCAGDLPAAPSCLLVLLVVLLLASCNGDGGVIPECGNDVVDGVEDCDDGNAVPCDGCSPDCEPEPGFVCGDGVVNTTCGEACDDGNTDPGDGCDENCRSETCGNGVVDVGEDCDDGNDVSCDGCSASCDVEPGFVCGDGVVNTTCGEACDDGNGVSCDGCSASCDAEPGFVCGDGVVNATCGEECDDGNTVPGDGCDENCVLESPPLSISGEYSVDIDGQDTCGLGTGPTSAPMEAIELGATRVSIDIPVGGAGGECNPKEFGRQGNTLTLVQSSMQQIGACTVQVDVTAVLNFFSDDTVTGFEDTTLTEAGGDCSSLNLPCQVELDLVGARCAGCFSCIMPAASAGRGVGPLGAAAGVTFEAMGRH